jgi:hypothetical protein
MSKCSIACRAAALVLGWAASALAGPRDILLLPVRVEPVSKETPVDLAPLAVQLELVLREAVQDFGLAPLAPSDAPAHTDETKLAELASDAWVLEPSLGLSGGEVRLRLAVVPHASRLLLVRAEKLEPSELEVKSLGMLRELLSFSRDAPERESPAPEPALPAANGAASGRSKGKAVLALHTAALGGYLGFALQRATGSDDARLTYPLAALGAGIGVGAAMVVADEWNVDVPQAWFLGAGMLWPGVSTLLIVDPEDADRPGGREMLGVVGALGGVTLATAGLVLGDITDGGAALTHSGAGLGLLLGGLGEMAIIGDADASPRRGLGWGALSGVLLAGTVATQLDVPSATDVLFIDLSALLGGLAGAALGTPVLVSQEASPTRDRIWLSGIIVGTITGATLSFWAADTEKKQTRTESDPTGAGLRLLPQLGWMGRPLGLGLTGEW